MAYLIMEENTGSRTTQEVLYNGSYIKYGVGFTGDGNSVTSIKVSLAKHGSPTGSVYLKIYNSGGGTYGSYDYPTSDTPLATSDTTLDISTLSSSDYAWKEFVFNTPFETANGTHYYAAVEYGGGDASNSLYFACNGVYNSYNCKYTSSWSGGYYHGLKIVYNDLEDTVAPTVTTSAVSSISTTTATGNGNVTSDGGATITERGVCVGLSTNPTTAGTHFTTTGTTGAFSVSMTGLNQRTLYYTRAYAINSIGTSYGSNETFTTTASPLTIYMRNDGSATSALTATDPSAAATSISPATHNSLTFYPGDTIKLSSQGGTFTTTLEVPSSGSAGSPITYTNVTGETPLIDPSVTISSWSGPTDGVYSSAVKSMILLTPTNAGIVWDNTGGGTTTPAQGKWSCVGTTTYYYPQSGAPGTCRRIDNTIGGGSYRCDGIHLLAKNYINISNIHFQYCRWAVGVHGNTASFSNINVDSCEAYRCLGMVDMTIPKTDGLTASYCSCTNSTSSYCGFGARWRNEGGGWTETGLAIYSDHITVTGNTIDHHGWIDGSTKWYNSQVVDGDCEGISFQNVKNSLIANNIITNGYHYGIFLYITNGTSGAATVSNTIKNNYVNVTSMGLQISWYNVSPCPGSGGNLVYNNIFNGCGDTDDIGGYATTILLGSINAGDTDSNPNTTPNTFYNNVIYDSQGYGMIFYLWGLGVWDIKNNIIEGTPQHVWVADQPSKTYTFDYNIYLSDGAAKFAYGGTASDFAGWKTNSGTYDAHSVIGDPLLVGTGSGGVTDFKLQAGSPCIRTGANLYSSGITTDYWGAPRYNAHPHFSIGAHQYWGTGSITLPGK